MADDKLNERAIKLLNKARTQYLLSGAVPLKDSMNPVESFLYEMNEFLAEVEAERTLASLRTPQKVGR